MEQQEAATVAAETDQVVPVLRDKLRGALGCASEDADAAYRREYTRALRRHLDRGVDEETAQALARESADAHRSEALAERTRQALLDLIADSKEMGRAERR